MREQFLFPRQLIEFADADLASNGGLVGTVPRAQTTTCRKDAGSVIALARMQEYLFEELFVKHVFAPLPAYLYGCGGCVHTPLMPTHIKHLRESNAERTRKTPGELFMYWFRARGYMTCSASWVGDYSCMRVWVMSVDS